MQINTNINSLTGLNSLRRLNISAGESMERISSGLRINKAADDPSGLAISKAMNAQIRGASVAVQNAQDGISLFSVIDGGLNEIQKILQRMRDLGVRATNEATLTQDDRVRLNDEFQSLVQTADQIAQNTTFNGKKVLLGNSGGTTGPTYTPLAPLVANNDFSGGIGGWSHCFSKTGNAQITWDPGYGQSMHFHNDPIMTSVGGDFMIHPLNAPIQAGDVATVRYYTAQPTFTIGSVYAAIVDNSPVQLITADYTDDVPQIAPGWYSFDLVVSNNYPAGYYFGLGIECNIGTWDWYFDEITFKRPVAPVVPADQPLQVGADNQASERIPVSLPDAASSTLGISSLDISSTAGALSAITLIDTALDALDNSRAAAGASERRLTNIAGDLNAQLINVAAANSRIEDADMASEITALTRSQINIRTAQNAVKSAVDSDVLIGKFVNDYLS